MAAIDPALVQPSSLAYYAYLPSLKYQAPAGWKPHWLKNGEMRMVPEGVTGTFDGLGKEFFKGLQALGVKRMWLSPPLDCPLDESGIGYNIQNYFKVSPLLGTEKSFKELIDRAGRHGIEVVMDLVLNHTSVQNPDFQASRNPKNPEHRLFVWQDPIRVGAQTANREPELAKAYAPLQTDADYGALKQKVEREGVDAVPHLELKLRDEQGNVLKKHDSRTGLETTEDLTVPVYPLPDWSKGVLYTDNKTTWIAYPKRDRDGNILYPPNNSLSLVTKNTAWVYDEKANQVYKAFFDTNQPDWAIGNREANERLIKVGEHWAKQGVGGFRLDAFRMAGAHPLLAVDGEEQRRRLVEAMPEAASITPLQRQLAIAGMTSNPRNTLRALFQDRGWENPSPTKEMLDELRARYSKATQGMSDEQVLRFAGQLDVELPKTSADTGTLFPPAWREWMHPDVGWGKAFWQEFRQRVNQAAGHPIFLQGEFGDDNRLGKAFHEAGTADCLYLSTYDQIKNLRDVRQATEAMLAAFPGGVGVDLEPTNHDTPRGFKSLTDCLSETEALAFRKLMWKFLSRVPCSQLTMYTGEELGLPNPSGAGVRAVSAERDIGLTLGYIHPDSNDNNTGRGAFPYNVDDFDSQNTLGGQGHMFRTPPEWTQLTYEKQLEDPTSVLHSVRETMRTRNADPVLSTTGSMTFLNYSKDGHSDDNVLIYTRSNGIQTYLFIDNFTKQPVEIDLEALRKQNPKADIDGLVEERRKAAGEAGVQLSVAAFDTAEIGRAREQAPRRATNPRASERG